MNITNDIITAYTETFYRSGSEELARLREFAEKEHVPIISRAAEDLISCLLSIKRPSRLLEIGSAVGYSASCFVSCCGCRVDSIEADREMYEAAASNTRALGYGDMVSIHHGDARDLLKAPHESGICEKGELFDAVFIDAAKSHYREFFDLCMPLCANDAVIICDNILMKGMTASDEYDTGRRYRTSIRKMREFVRYINGLSYTDTCVLAVGDGISVSIIDRDAYDEEMSGSVDR